LGAGGADLGEADCAVEEVGDGGTGEDGGVGCGDVVTGAVVCVRESNDGVHS
jgi:hypothetical protein